jgi:DNA topoisomerase I
VSRAATRTTAPDPLDPARAARRVGLRYVSDEMPGITRRRAGRGFSYRDSAGRPVRDAATLDRIQAIVVPPAWQDVWICELENGHLQATGRDARRRKQYRYHKAWQRARSEHKFDRVADFGRVLPRVRKRVDRDLRLPGVPRDKVLAAVVRLLDTCLMRVGNSEYARLNKSFGLTTIRDHHAAVRGETISFHYAGKSGKVHDVRVVDRRIARVVRRCQELDGQELFAYRDEAGEVCDVGSSDVNEYLRESAGEGFSAKDFRTFGGSVVAAEALALSDQATSKAGTTRIANQAIKLVAAELGNTPAVARASYIHPAIVDGYLNGTLPLDELRSALERGGGRQTERIVIEYLEKIG